MITRMTKPTRAVLWFLLDATHEVYGYAVYRRTGLNGPTVCDILNRLEAAGWVTARWDEAGPARGRLHRKLYRLTPEGERLARIRLSSERSPKCVRVDP